MWSHQVVFGLGHVGVVGPQLALVDLQCAAVVVHHLLVLSLVLTQQCQVIQLLSHIGVVLPQNLSTLRKTKGGCVRVHAGIKLWSSGCLKHILFIFSRHFIFIRVTSDPRWNTMVEVGIYTRGKWDASPLPGTIHIRSHRGAT